MTVLKGEGKVPILYGTSDIAAGPVTHTGYLARPDLTGEWPTIILLPTAWGVTSAVKDLCRRIARQGFAVVAPDLYRAKPPSRDASREEAAEAFAKIPTERAMKDLADVVDFIGNPAGFWSSGEYGFGIFALGAGVRHGIALAKAEPLTEAVALAYPEFDAQISGFLGELAAPLLVIAGKADEVVPFDDLASRREAIPHAEWVVYDGVGHDFLDDYLPEFDEPAHHDAIERLAEFFGKHLPEAPPS